MEAYPRMVLFHRSGRPDCVYPACPARLHAGLREAWRRDRPRPLRFHIPLRRWTGRRLRLLADCRAQFGRIARRLGRERHRPVNRVLAYLFRFIIIIAGYGMAALAASAFLNVVMLAWFGLTPEETRLVATGSFFFSIPFVAIFVAYFAFIPSAFAIVIGEVAGKRDWLFYAMAGAVVALLVLGFSRTGEETAFAEIADLNF